MENKNLHKDHRKRVRTDYFRNGIESMEEYKVLELLLFFGIPFKDTNNTAHELIEAFGSLNAVLDAPKEELMKIKDIGENAATLIKLTHDIAVKYNEEKMREKITVATDNRFMDYLLMKYLGETCEIVYLLCIDSHGKIRNCAKVCKGSPDKATVDNRTIVEAAIRFDAKEVILAHNHPNGFAVPSVADVKATESLIKLFESISINLVDHIIVADSECFSMASSKKYGKLFI